MMAVTSTADRALGRHKSKTAGQARGLVRLIRYQALMSVP